jgi:hypothetical protein
MIKCYRDERGFRRVDPNGLRPLIASFLEDDVQGCLPTCQELLDILDGFENGQGAEWSETGNAHTVTIRPGVVEIRRACDDGLGEARFPHDVFRACLEDWKTFISQ